MGKTILQAAEALVEALAGRTPIAEVWQTIRDLEHKGDAVARDMFEMLMTPQPTLVDRDALKALTGYLDDILDAIEAAAARLAIHRVRRAIPAARELGQIVLESARELTQVLRLRVMRDLFPHTRALHRLENRGDDVLRDAIGSLFSGRPCPPKCGARITSATPVRSTHMWAGCARRLNEAAACASSPSVESATAWIFGE